MQVENAPVLLAIYILPVWQDNTPYPNLMAYQGFSNHIPSGKRLHSY